MLEFEEIDAKVFRTVLNVLKEVDPEVTKGLRTELKTKLQPSATKLADQMPQISPLIGMQHPGPTGYKPPRGKVSFTPGGGKAANRLVAIQLDSGRQRGFYIADLAGTKSKGSTTQGRAMIDKLNRVAPLSSRRKRGGRFGWANFIKIYPQVRKIAVDTIDETLAKLERQL